MNSIVIPRFDNLEFLITIHPNLKTKRLEQINQVSRAIKNYFNKSFPHRKDPYFLLIVNEQYPDGDLQGFLHLHILLGQLSNQLYQSSRKVQEFSVKYPFPKDPEEIITHKQLFLNEFFNSMKFNKKPLIEEKGKRNIYGLTDTKKVLDVVPVKGSPEKVYSYLEKYQDTQGIDLLDTMNSLFVKS
jgi:hypothetical protein